MKSRGNAKVVEMRGDIFIAYLEKKYDVDRCRKIDLFSQESDIDYPPQVPGFTAYKLHISLTNTSYLAHKDHLRDIIQEHMSSSIGGIKEFKMVDIEKTLLKIKKDEDIYNDFKKYLDYLEGKNKYFDLQSFRKKIDKYYQLPDALSKITNIDPEFNYIKLAKRTRKRFLKGDQFTIYIHQGYSHDNLVSLCVAIENYLNEQHASPGFHTDVVVPLGRFISLKKDYLTEDFEEMAKTMRVDESKRIEAVACSPSQEEILKRSKAKSELLNSELYIALKRDMEKDKMHPMRLFAHASLPASLPNQKTTELHLSYNTQRSNHA